MTLANITDRVQEIFNDIPGINRTDTIVDAEVNRVLKDLCLETRFMGIYEGTINTDDSTTARFSLPSVTETVVIGTMFALSCDPVYEDGSIIRLTDEDWLASQYGPTWRTETTSSAPSYAVLENTGQYIRFYPKPTAANKNITMAGWLIHADLNRSTLTTPKLSEVFHPILIHGAVVYQAESSGESTSGSARLAFSVAEYARLKDALHASASSTALPRVIRGSRPLNPVIERGPSVTPYSW